MSGERNGDGEHVVRTSRLCMCLCKLNWSMLDEHNGDGKYIVCVCSGCACAYECIGVVYGLNVRVHAKGGCIWTCKHWSFKSESQVLSPTG